MDWNPFQAWPDWTDNLRRVEVQYEDGSRLTGVLTIKDVDHDDPLFVVMVGEEEHSFVDNEQWRFLDRKPAGQRGGE